MRVRPSRFRDRQQVQAQTLTIAHRPSQKLILKIRYLRTPQPGQFKLHQKVTQNEEESL